MWLKNRRKIWLAAPGDLNFQPLSFVIGRLMLKVGLANPKEGFFILPFPLDEHASHQPQTADQRQEANGVPPRVGFLALSRWKMDDDSISLLR